MGGSGLQRIVLVSPDGFSILNIFKELINIINREKNWEIIAICSSDKYIPVIKELGVKHISIKMDRYISPLQDLGYLIALYKVFKNEHFDVVINFTLKPIIYGTIAAKLTGNNFIISAFRGLGRIFQSELDTKGRFLKYVVMGLLWVACTCSRKVWFTNKNDCSYFLSKGIVREHKIILTNNGINIEHFSLGAVDKTKMHDLRKELSINEDNRVIIMVARLLWPKGIKEFVDAAKIVIEEYPSVKFLLVGSLEDKTPQYVPESFLKEHEKLGYFKWLGFREDVRELYAISDIAVLPSYYKEGGYPRALLEPMAMGKPVITTDTPECRGPVEVGKNGYLVPAKDAKSLANAIKDLFNDDEKRDMFGSFSRLKAVNEFDEKVIMSKIFNEIILQTCRSSNVC